jgi:hypothetical protein
MQPWRRRRGLLSGNVFACSVMGREIESREYIGWWFKKTLSAALAASRPSQWKHLRFRKIGPRQDIG